MHSVPLRSNKEFDNMHQPAVYMHKRRPGLVRTVTVSNLAVTNRWNSLTDWSCLQREVDYRSARRERIRPAKLQDITIQ